MARNILVINVDLRETRVALIENGVIAELQVERAAHRGSVGNIVLGKVTRVLPGMPHSFAITSSFDGFAAPKSAT